MNNSRKNVKTEEFMLFMTLKTIVENNDYKGMSAYLDNIDTSVVDNSDELVSFLFANKDNLINFFSSYSLSLCENEENFIYLEKLFTCIQNSHFAAQYELTNFIWQFEGFQKLLCYAPTFDRGSMYTEKSIFRSLINSSHEIHAMDILMTAYEVLVKKQPYFLIRYIKQIFVLNKAYYFEGTMEMITTESTSYQLCLFCVLLMAKVVQQYPDNQEAYLTFMMGAQYILLPLNLIVHTLSMSNCNEHTQHLLNWFCGVVKSFAIQSAYAIFLDFDHVQTIPDASNFLLSLCEHFSYFTGVQLREVDKIEDFVIQVLDSSLHVNIKFYYVKLAVSHSLCSGKLYELHKGLKRYIMDDFYGLDIPRFVKIIHLVNIVCKFGEIFDNDMILYVYSEMSTMEDYLKYATARIGIVSTQMSSITYDLSHLVNAVSFVMANFNGMGPTKNSFLYDILHLLFVMACALQHPSVCSPFIEVFTKKCILHIPILFDACKEIIIDETFACLIDELNKSFDELKEFETDKPSEFFDSLKIFRSDLRIIDKHDNFTDAITCGIVINPVYLDIPEGVLIDFKTAFNLAKTKKNPYTRDNISLSSLQEYNERDEIKQKILQLKSDLANCVTK